MNMKTTHYQHTPNNSFTWCGLRAANWRHTRDWHKVTCEKCFPGIQTGMQVHHGVKIDSVWYRTTCDITTVKQKQNRSWTNVTCKMCLFVKFGKGRATDANSRKIHWSLQRAVHYSIKCGTVCGKWVVPHYLSEIKGLITCLVCRKYAGLE